MVDPFEQMIKQLKSAETAAIMANLPSDASDLLTAAQRAKQLASIKGVQARMPFWVEFK